MVVAYEGLREKMAENLDFCFPIFVGWDRI